MFSRTSKYWFLEIAQVCVRLQEKVHHPHREGSVECPTPLSAYSTSIGQGELFSLSIGDYPGREVLISFYALPGYCTSRVRLHVFEIFEQISVRV